MRIGSNILQVRKEKGLRRSDLVKRLRLAYGTKAVDYRTIERIESGDIARGRLSTLLQIADALEIPIDQLRKGTELEDTSKQEERLEQMRIVRSRDRGGIFNYNDKASIEIISPPETGYIFYLLKLRPGGATKTEQDPEGAVKFLFVLSGAVTVRVGNTERILMRGDSIQIHSSRIHSFENGSKKPASALLYQNPKRF